MAGSYSQPVTRYLVFLNPDGVCKDVSYEISRHWTYTNYIDLTTGIAAADGGFSNVCIGTAAGEAKGLQPCA